MSHDGTVRVSVGVGRHSTEWKNYQVPWLQLAKRLGVTKVTPETHAEYIQMHKDKQTDIKDIGGFVGGVLEGSRRLKSAVSHRTLITLDADAIPEGFDLCSAVTTVYPSASVIYSTHKHTPEKNRLRVVMPLNRSVTTDEHEAIARKIADSLGMDMFDPCSFLPNTLMYFPSTSKDSPFFYNFHDAPWLDADFILNQYEDWRDTSQWACTPTEKKEAGSWKPSSGNDKLPDPRLKSGVIGSFCRHYTITQAIAEFIPDVYTPTNQIDRFTYTQGSASKGLQVFDDLYAYSRHGTDPANTGHCYNAFDLVRIHKFGNLD